MWLSVIEKKKTLKTRKEMMEKTCCEINQNDKEYIFLTNQTHRSNFNEKRYFNKKEGVAKSNKIYSQSDVRKQV